MMTEDQLLKYAYGSAAAATVRIEHEVGEMDREMREAVCMWVVHACANVLAMHLELTEDDAVALMLRATRLHVEILGGALEMAMENFRKHQEGKNESHNRS